MAARTTVACVGAALLSLASCGGGTGAVSSCATAAAPDFAATDAFDVDTGVGFGSGAG